MKITNICAIPLGTENAEAVNILSDCGLPNKIIPINGGTAINLSDITSMAGFNAYVSRSVLDDDTTKYEQLDTKAAAFETVNGESILVYYSPNCESNRNDEHWQWVTPKLCANFVYDLNGKKGPNTVGKDIGFITALYAVDPIVVAPQPYPTDASDAIAQTDVAQKCKEMDENAKAPSIDELASMFYNMKLLGIPRANSYWSSTQRNATTAYRQYFAGTYGHDPRDWEFRLRCIKR